MLLVLATVLPPIARARAVPDPTPPPPSPWWRAYLAGSRAVALPDGRTLNLYCEGEGGPTVIMEAGLGSGAWTWHTVQHQIAVTARVCSYDRAGYFGRSTPVAGPRSAGAEADDLAALLKAARIPPPYVLVGHSYGGYIVRLYAYRHPRDVAGLVLVDPSSEYQDRLDRLTPSSALAASGKLDAQMRRCAVASRPADEDCLLRPVPADLPTDLRPWFVGAQDAAYADTMVREQEAMDTVSSAQLDAERRSLGSIPVVVLEQDVSLLAAQAQSPEERAAAEAWGRGWHELHLRTLSGISTKFSLRPVAGARHRMQVDHAAVVIDAVREVLFTAHAAHRAK